MPDEPKKYLAVVQLRADTAPADLARRLPGLHSYFKELSGGEMQLAFTSADALSFGMLFTTNRPAGVIRSQLDGATPNGDKFLVVEVGACVAEKGQGAPANWLKYH